jgi:hypothetical protein
MPTIGAASEQTLLNPSNVVTIPGIKLALNESDKQFVTPLPRSVVCGPPMKLILLNGSNNVFNLLRLLCNCQIGIQ